MLLFAESASRFVVRSRAGQARRVRGDLPQARRAAGAHRRSDRHRPAANRCRAAAGHEPPAEWLIDLPIRRTRRRRGRSRCAGNRMQPRVLILRAPGTNCDQETAFAFETAGARAERRASQPAAGEPDAGRRLSDPVHSRRLQLRRRHLRRPHFRQPDSASPARCAAGVQGRRQADPGHLQRLSDSDQDRACCCPTGPTSRSPRSRSTTAASSRTAGCICASPARKCVFLRGIERMYLPVAHAEGQVRRPRRGDARASSTRRGSSCCGTLPIRSERLRDSTSPDCPSSPIPPTPTAPSSPSPACATKRAASSA